MSKDKEQKSNLPSTQNTNVPDYLRNNDGITGTEDISANDSIIPRIKICQGQTKAKENLPDLRDGEIYNTISGRIGKAFEFFILAMWKSKIWFFEKKLVGVEFVNPSNKTQMIRYGNMIEQIITDKTKDKEGKTFYERGIESFNYMIASASDIEAGIVPEIAIYSASSAACKPARQLNGRLKSRGQRGFPIYSEIIKLESIKQSFTDGDAFMPSFSWIRDANQEEANILKSLFTSARAMMMNEDTHLKTEEGADTSFEFKD